LPRGLLLVNSKSRSGATGAEPALDALRAGGVALCEPRPDENWTDAIRARARDVQMVVVGGGDGSLNAAATGLIETKLPLGIIPLGTGNDLARTLGLPLDPVKAAQVILDGKTRDIDLGDVNGKPYFNVASVGLSVELAKKLDPDVKRRFGRFGYIVAASRVLSSARPFTVVIDDGETRARGRTYQVAIGNGRFYGGGNAIHHAAEIDDGVLHLYSLEMKSIWKLVALAPFFRRGRHHLFEEVRSLQAANFEIVTRRPRSINADGEIIAQTPAKFSIRRDAICVFAPEAEAPAESLVAGLMSRVTGASA
jgi:diacylglycerol kinase (ATP)